MKIKNIIIILILFIMMMIIYPIPSKSVNLGLGDDLSQYVDVETTSEKFKSKIELIFTVIKSVGVCLSVIILVVIGIKFMLGSVEEKAEYKKSLIPYIYGALILFATSFVPQLIFDLIRQINLK